MAVQQSVISPGSNTSAGDNATFASLVTLGQTVVVVGFNTGYTQGQRLNAPQDNATGGTSTYHSVYGSEIGSTSGFSAQVWYAYNVAATPSLKVTLKSTGYFCCGLTLYTQIGFIALVLDPPAVIGTSPLDQQNVNATALNTGTHDYPSPSVTTTSANEVLVGVATAGGTYVLSLGANGGWPAGALYHQAAVGSTSYAESLVVTSIGTYAADFTATANVVTGNSPWAGIVTFLSVPPVVPPSGPPVVYRMRVS